MQKTEQLKSHIHWYEGRNKVNQSHTSAFKEMYIKKSHAKKPQSNSCLPLQFISSSSQSVFCPWSLKLTNFQKQSSYGWEAETVSWGKHLAQCNWVIRGQELEFKAMSDLSFVSSKTWPDDRTEKQKGQAKRMMKVTENKRLKGNVTRSSITGSGSYWAKTSILDA